MSYIDPANLLRFGAANLAQLASAQLDDAVAADVLKDTLLGGDVSGYSQAQRDLATAAVDWFALAGQEAAKRVDSYLANRYTLPLTTSVVYGSPVKSVCEEIAYYRLHVNGADDSTRIRYTDALTWLKDVARGVTKIAGVDTDQVENSGSRRTTTAISSGIDWDNYG